MNIISSKNVKDIIVKTLEIVNKEIMRHGQVTSYILYKMMDYEHIYTDQETIDFVMIALLHDIGRHRQYLEGIPHEQGSAALAQTILTDCGYSPAEQEEIVSAILRHRLPETGAQNDLAGLLFRADKASRLCMFCGAAEACNWRQDKNNISLKY